ncbi:MAG: hypothetical protein HY286_02720 [Planctomycetes bacterium]|nr:hypothetical protein [Planctomycetota bacterium]
MNPPADVSLPNLQILIAHRERLLRIGRALTGDAQLAEDAVSDAAAILLTNHRAAAQSGLSWVAGIVRKLSLRAARARTRRREREAAYAGHGDADATADLVAQHQIYNELTALILTLDEPCRSAVVEYYYHQIPAREIAARRGIPIETARTHVKRGIQQLRDRARRKFGVEWTGAIAALPLIQLASWKSAIAFSVGAKKTTAAAALVLLCIGSYVFFYPKPPVPAAPSAAPTVALADERGASRPATRAAETTIAASRAPVSEAAPASAVGARDPHAEIRGKVVFSDGTPAKGAQITLVGWCWQSQKLFNYRDRIDWKDQPTIVDDSGNFIVPFVPPPPYGFRLEIRRPGTFGWDIEWPEIANDRHIDIGTIILMKGGRVRGTIRMASGEPLIPGWRVACYNSEDVVFGAPHMAAGGSHRTIVDPATGSFTLDDLPTCRCGLSVELRTDPKTSAAFLPGKVIQLKEGEEQVVDFVYDGPRLSDRVKVIIYTSNLSAVTLSGPGIGVRPATKNAYDPNEAGAFFMDVPPGKYTLTIDLPGFEKYIQENVEPGPAPVRVVLRGNAGVRLFVYEGTSKVPSREFAADFTSFDVFSNKNKQHLQTADAPVPEDFIYRGLEGGLKYQLDVFSNRTNRFDSQTIVLAPGEIKNVEFHLGDPASIAGVLVSSGSEPLGRTKVQIFRPAAKDDSPDSMYLFPPMSTPDDSRHRVLAGESTTDASGRFRILKLSPGRYIARAALPDGSTAVRDDLYVDSGQELEDVRLQFERPGSIDGIIQLGDRDAASVKIIFTKTQRNGIPVRLSTGAALELSASPDAQGRFRVESAGAGNWQAEAIITKPDAEPARIGLGAVAVEPGVATRFDRALDAAKK